jgi:hypothetical protein
VDTALEQQRWKDEQLLVIATSLDGHISDLRRPPDHLASADEGLS